MTISYKTFDHSLTVLRNKGGQSDQSVEQGLTIYVIADVISKMAFSSRESCK